MGGGGVLYGLNTFLEFYFLKRNDSVLVFYDDFRFCFCFPASTSLKVSLRSNISTSITPKYKIPNAVYF